MADRFVTRQATFCVIRNDKGEILLQQRANTGYLDGYWDLPSGHLEYGEDMRICAARELEEEMGLTATAESLRLIHIDQYFLDKDYTNFVFEVDAWQGEPKICEPEKCSAIGWFAPGAFPEKCVNVVRVTEHGGFGGELTYSVTDRATYAEIMREPFAA
ncbi:MAG TPA: NUDIX domain-containing protein [Candidatus Saccharimonadia bacterium]|nr:NUDIX domain-containing protein [Candidatus Saccharimonadia bacterium]